jgi:hypothetical protein
MTTSYRRFISTMLATMALLVISAAGSGGVAAAERLHPAGAANQVALHSVLTTAPSPATKGNGQGDNGQGGNGQGGNGQGTVTPELPSGVLFGIGLLPLAIGLFLVWRRRRPARS